MISRKELLKRNQPRYKKKCKICGKGFVAKKPQHLTCSEKCYKANCKILNAKWILNNWEKNLAIKNASKKRIKRRKEKELLIHTTPPKYL